jgi:hypothetical protein
MRTYRLPNTLSYVIKEKKTMTTLFTQMLGRRRRLIRLREIHHLSRSHAMVINVLFQDSILHDRHIQRRTSDQYSYLFSSGQSNR